MKPERFWKHALLVGAIAVAAYFLLFNFIEHRRVDHGPWEVNFTSSTNGAPALVIAQPGLGLTNITLIFADAPATNAAVTLRFAEARVTPFPTPYGICVFLDTISLPGTVTLDLFGHQVQLLPRVLTVDRLERPWKSGEVIVLGNAAAPPQR